MKLLLLWNPNQKYYKNYISETNVFINIEEKLII